MKDQRGVLLNWDISRDGDQPLVLSTPPNLISVMNYSLTLINSVCYPHQPDADSHNVFSLAGISSSSSDPGKISHLFLKLHYTK